MGCIYRHTVHMCRIMIDNLISSLKTTEADLSYFWSKTSEEGKVKKENDYDIAIGCISTSSFKVRSIKQSLKKFLIIYPHDCTYGCPSIYEQLNEDNKRFFGKLNEDINKVKKELMMKL